MDKVVALVKYGTKVTYTTLEGQTFNEEFWGDNHAQRAIAFLNEKASTSHYFAPLNQTAE